MGAPVTLLCYASPPRPWHADAASCGILRAGHRPGCDCVLPSLLDWVAPVEDLSNRSDAPGRRHCAEPGNAIMLSGFNRAASVTKSHFAWTGGTAVAAWGRTDEIGNNGNNGWDATAGDIPAGTVIADNIMRESGIWEK